LILLAFAVVATGSLSTPLQEWDAFAIWGLKAKVLAHAALRPVPPYFHDLSLSYSHLDYPLMLPFLTAGAYAAMNVVDDQTGKLVSVFLDLLVVPVIYLGLRWKLPRLAAACLAAVFALLPAMFRFGGTGCADLPLAMFYAGSIYFTAKWLAELQRPNLALAILFSAFAAFTKNEGLVLALANGVVILGFGLWRGQRRNLIAGVVFFAGFLTINAAWLIWNHSLPKTHEDYGSKLLSTLFVTHLPRLKEIIPEMVVQAVEPRSWGLLWIMAAIFALSNWRGIAQRHVLAVWILLTLHLGSYVLAYLVTPWDLAVLMSATMERLLFHAAPAILLLTGWHWAEAEKSWRIKPPPAPRHPATPPARPPCETSR
jgi:4-amino-4-deoxy-L-arabinose transferase-like glycosyltransferase